MLNEVVLLGRMTRDPELRRTASGTPVANFTLALDRGFTGQGNQQADFIPCVVWNKMAESVERYCSKGSLVAIRGRLQSRTYQNQDGKNTSVLEVICETIKFVDTKKNTKPETEVVEETKVVDNSKMMEEPTVFENQPVSSEEPIQSFDIKEDDIQF